MSDNWITLIPENPRFVPTKADRDRARDLLAQIARDADEIEMTVSESIEFFDSGVNFERVRCPACRSEIPMKWWTARMNEDHENGFKLAAYQTPCCLTPLTLHELNCEWPQGFGRFALEAMNPKTGELQEHHKTELEVLLGTRLRVIYQHI